MSTLGHKFNKLLKLFWRPRLPYVSRTSAKCASSASSWPSPKLLIKDFWLQTQHFRSLWKCGFLLTWHLRNTAKSPVESKQDFMRTKTEETVCQVVLSNRIWRIGLKIKPVNGYLFKLKLNTYLEHSWSTQPVSQKRMKWPRPLNTFLKKHNNV